MMSSILSSTYPAPLVMTVNASHMIAPFILFDPYFALRTVSHIPTIDCPLFEILIHCVLTFYVSVPLLTTIETNFKSTLALDFTFISFSYIVVTVRSWAPF